MAEVNKLVSIILIGASAPLLAGVLLLLVPALRSAEAVATVEIDEHVERARRLLHLYGENEERLADILRQLHEHGVDSAAEGNDLERVLDEQREVVEQVEDTINQHMRGRMAGLLRDVEERYRAVGGDDESPVISPGGLGRNISAIVRSAREGIKARDAILAENDRLLEEARREADAAVNVSQRGADGSRHRNANRVKGIILAAQADALRRKARWSRALTVKPRDALVELTQRVTRLAVEKELLEQSRISDQLDALHGDAEQIRRTIDKQAADIKRLDATIHDLESRIKALADEGNRARTAMDKLEDQGVNFLDPDGSEAFANRFVGLSRQHQQAIAEAHGLEYGTLTGARLDDSGDYIRGLFVPVIEGGEITTQRGLLDYRHDRETAAADLAGLKASLADIEENIAILEEIAKGYAAKASAATEAAQASRGRAADVYAEFERLANEADDLIEQAVKKARLAVQAFRTAAGAAGSDAHKARGRADALSPASRERSWYKLRSEDVWSAGQITNEAAQTKLLLGSILHARYSAAVNDLDVLTRAKEALEIATVDLAVYTERRDAAREEASDAVRAAITDFERTSRDLGGNWTIPAQVAAAHYLLSLVEHPGHVATAVQNYEAAVQGAEGGPQVQSLAERLESLKSRLLPAMID
ncbi:MAG: hypothetical protein V3W34_08450 [Phycisphaerae bacterium]